MAQRLMLTIVGCGDAFGSGGRLQTSFLAECAGQRWLIDCGATTMLGLNRAGIDPNSIATIVISHLHGDHFAGLVWWLLHGQHVGKRTAPLDVYGPPGIAARFAIAAEALFPGSTTIEPRFAMRFVELAEGRPQPIGQLTVTPFEVEHPSGAPTFALRFEIGHKVLAFSADTEWTDKLLGVCRGADLAILESFWFEGSPRYHMSWRTIEANLDRLAARRVLLTHMGEPMLARRAEVTDPRVILAEDGLVVSV